MEKKKEHRTAEADSISECLFALGELDELQLEFSDALWHTAIDHVTVYADEYLVFHFKNGSEISVTM